MARKASKSKIVSVFYRATIEEIKDLIKAGFRVQSKSHKIHVLPR